MRMARNIYHRKDGRFEGRYVKGFNEKGKKKYGSVFGKSYAEVKQKLEKVAQPGIATPVIAIGTVVDAVALYLESLKYQIKQSTHDVYQRYLGNHIAPYFGNMKCETLTPEIMQNFVNKQMENGLSPVTVQALFSFLKAGVKSNDSDIFAVKLPKKPKSSAECLSLDEQKRLETAAKETSSVDYLAVMLTLYTGIRLGELCGLQWNDIDFECRILHIRRTMQRIRSKGGSKTELALLPPKSLTSERAIPLPEFMVSLLKEQKITSDCEYVIAIKGNPAEPRSVQRRFKKLLVTAEVKNVNFHTTRHTFATRALESGFDVKSLSEILGHGSATVTLNKYAHALDEQKRLCMNGLSEIYSCG